MDFVRTIVTASDATFVCDYGKSARTASTASDAYELVRLSVCDFRHYGKSARTASLRQVMRMNSYDYRCATFGITEKCEDCQLRQVMRMNLYDDRCATFGITEKVRGLPVTASDAYELVRLSVCDFRHYEKVCEDCQVRQVMRMNLYDDRCATFGITEKVRGLPVTASDAYELVRLSCEDCQLRQVMRMNSYDDRCATFGITEKVRGLPVTAGDAYELVRRSCATFGLTKKVRGLREMSRHMNIDISNAHCGPRISFPDHAWLRVVYKNEPDCSLARESVDLGARLYLSLSTLLRSAGAV
ncbi:unnamed protein product [Trichogramma brassicae]|uniref:Uncharacterized protein n=1 Tax=Trichogramma brassicae TaxID=86971 RepID=A0A6H5IJE8_9HYME|nr:unnamed protein product [Trichogramma brassicae]